jgi:outer membrane murein-binding lipoprotein Lpp
MIAERVERLEGEVRDLGIKIDGLATRVGGLETKVDGLETKVNGLETKVNGLETKVDSLETKVDSLETKVDGLGNRTGRVEVQLEHLRDTLNTFTSMMGARFDALDHRLEEHHKQFAAKFFDNDLVLTNHNKRITTLERRTRRRT